MTTLKKLLETAETRGGSKTHVSKFYKRSYLFDREKIEEFWDIYCRAVIEESKDVISIGEMPGEYLPIICDADIEVEDNDELDLDVRLYTDEQLEFFVRTYQSVIRSTVEGVTEKNLRCFVFEKPPYRREKGGKNYIKNGFHLHFIIFVSKKDLEVYINPEIVRDIKESNIFSNLGMEDSSKVVDFGVINLPWLLYGAQKEPGTGCYELTRIYNSDLDTIDKIDDALEGFVIYDVKENKIDFDGNEAFYLPRFLSINVSNRQIHSLKPGLTSGLKEKYKRINSPTRKKTRQDISAGEAIEKAKHILNFLDDYRADDRSSWMQVGWTLFNIGDGSLEALDLWLEFSMRCPDKYDEGNCISEWEKMRPGNSSLGSLIYYAKQDNLKEYTKYMEEQSQKYVKESLNGSHNDIAKALYEKYGSEFICCSMATNSWYRFESHHWQRMEEGHTLRKLITDEMAPRYAEISKKIIDDMREAPDADEKGPSKQLKVASQLIMKVKDANFKNNVMKECKEVFYKENFLDFLDKNHHLVGLLDGVFDLKTNNFRAGIPEDYISIQMPFTFPIELDDRSQEVNEIYEFLEKIFPDKSVRDFFLDCFCDVFIGGNPQKIVLFWIGEGDNGKSVTIRLLMAMLGKYAVNLPISLLTGKRTQSSSANPELIRAGSARFCSMQESDKGEKMNTGLMKEMSGNDLFYARDLFQKGTDVKEIEPMFKLSIICNKPPVIDGDKAVWNRILVLPFESVFRDDAPEDYNEQVKQKHFPRDPDFNSKIKNLIRPFFWVLINHRRRGKRMIIPDKVKYATNMYKQKMDIYQQYINDCVVSDKKANIPEIELYNSFKEWFKGTIGINKVPTKNDFTEQMNESLGNLKMKKWHGFRLRVSKDDKDPSEETENSEEQINENIPEL